MSNNKIGYDWAEAALSLQLCDSKSFNDLVRAADLDPVAGDLIDIDLSGLDLREQDMSGWNLRYANFRGARIAGADLTNALLNTESLIDALDWSEATLSNDTRLDAIFSLIRSTSIHSLPVSVSTSKFLIDLNIKTIDDLFMMPEYDLLADSGPKASVLEIINELREVLDEVNLKFIDDAPDESEGAESIDFGRHWVFLHPGYDEKSIDDLQKRVKRLLVPPEKRKRRAMRKWQRS